MKLCAGWSSFWNLITPAIALKLGAGDEMLAESGSIL